MFTSKKNLTVTVQNKDISFPVKKNQSILDAGLAAGLDFPFSCKSGSCGTCKCQLVAGQTQENYPADGTLEPDEIASGMILACQNIPQSDVVIDIDDSQIEQFRNSYKPIPATIVSQEALTHDIQKLVLKTEDRISYIPGQYADLSSDAIGEPRSYSFASATGPKGSNQLEFHVRLVPGGAMTTWLHEADRSGTAMQLRGPFGNFYLRQTDAPILMIAGGSGMAPIKALLEGCENTKRPLSYIFGARSQRDLYCLDEIRKLGSKWKAPFSFIPILSEEPADSDWTGARGLVTDLIEEHFQDAGTQEAYLCGPPIMIDKSIELLQKSGIASNRIFFDRFVDKSHQ